MLALWMLSMVGARAEAWIPEAGSGSIEPMVRYSFSASDFPANSFSTTAHPGTVAQKTQIRIEGDYGLGGGFALYCDFRYAFRVQSKKTATGFVHSSSNGFQEQLVGVRYGLTQDSNFADSIGIAIVAPGGNGRQAKLDSGRWAVEPIYNAGLKFGFWNLTGDFDIGSRMYLDGGAAQIRSHLKIGAPIFEGVHLSGRLFVARTIRMSAYEANDSGELYNVVRLGAEARIHLAHGVNPVLGYETEVAGMGRHAEQRLTIGFKFRL